MAEQDWRRKAAVVATVVATTALWAGAGTARAEPTAWPDYMARLPAGVSESPVDAALPADVAVVAPGSTVPPEIARWSGLWQGWACAAQACDVKLAVEALSPTGATLAYAGASSRQAPVSERVQARFVDGELVAQLRTGSKLVLRLRPDGDMEMSLWRAGGPLLSAGVLTQKAQARPYRRSTERVPTPWTEDGKALTLEMVVYRPVATPGPWPTLVFNHGSTGEGNQPAWFKFTWASPEVGRYFAERGWQVVFPQRRGRGQSDGLYDEGFEADRSRYACRPEQSLPGIDRAMADLDATMAALRQRPDVDTTRLLIGGVSRGGILSVAYAGSRPQLFAGVINFVGGWVGDRCPAAGQINPVAFRRGAAFRHPTLWLYGDGDPYYALQHSRKNFAAFEAAGGTGQFVALPVPQSGNGHAIHTDRSLWESPVSDYLQRVVPPR